MLGRLMKLFAPTSRDKPRTVEVRGGGAVTVVRVPDWNRVRAVLAFPEGTLPSDRIGCHGHLVEWLCGRRAALHLPPGATLTLCEGPPPDPCEVPYKPRSDGPTLLPFARPTALEPVS